jgi:hypothetical protein
MESEQTNELNAALAKAQAVMKAAPFDKVNPHFKSKYATLASVVETIRKPLADNGLSYTQTTVILDTGFVLLTKLRHTSGQWIASEYPLRTGLKPQEMGSELTYARRYSLSSIVCIAADEDDDANAAQTNGQHVTSQPPRRENPSVNRIEEIIDERPRFDTAGKRIDWIDTSMHRVKHLTGEPAKALYKTLRQAMGMCETVAELEDWGMEHAEQVAQLGKSEEYFQLREYQVLLDQLRETSAKRDAA